MAEWLRNGLQNRVHQFNSGRGLQLIPVISGILHSPPVPSVERAIEFADACALRASGDLRSKDHNEKSPGGCRGFCRDRVQPISVPGDDRATPVEAVVDASGDEVHVLADRVSAEYAADRYDGGTQNTCRRETVTLVTHEQVIVLDRN